MDTDRDVLVIATDEDYWELQTKCKLACHYGNTRAGARYVAFYRVAPISAITHYARVLREDRNVDPWETVGEVPRLVARGVSLGWIHEPHTRYVLAGLVKLPEPIVKMVGEQPIRAKRWTSLDRLARARTLSDL